MTRRYQLASEYPCICTKALFSPPFGCKRFYQSCCQIGFSRKLALVGPFSRDVGLPVFSPPGLRHSTSWASAWHHLTRVESIFNHLLFLTTLCHAFTQTGLVAQKLYLSCHLANLINS